VRRFLFLGAIFSLCALAGAQTPTLVQHVSCPNSGGAGSGIGGAISGSPVYSCPLPEPTQAGNAIILGLISNNSGNPTWTVSDDKSNSWNLATSTTDSRGNIVAVYYALNVAAGTRMLSVGTSAATQGNLAVSASEYYNVASSAAVDAKSCNAGGNSTSISAGSITPSASGDLLWQWAATSNTSSVSSFTAGSQSNIAWQLNGTDIDDGDATQAGVYTSTAAIVPTFSSGSSQPFDSCVVALKAASAGNAPTKAFRIVHMLHEQETASAPSTYPVEMPTSGNLVVLSFISGGNAITGINSVPANNWAATGAAISSGQQATSQIYYAANASSSNSMTLSINQNGTMTGSTFMLYDFVGAAASPFDVDSGGLEGDQKSAVNSLTSCSNCFTPSAANEAIIGNIGNAWCTATALTAPSGGLFDVAVYTGNSVNGPESVDQNNGWFHYYSTSASPITVTWTYLCGDDAEGVWTGRLAAFKPGSQNQPAPPTGLTGTVVPQS
jgi:hypothetical protein